MQNNGYRPYILNLAGSLSTRKNLPGLKRKANNHYFALIKLYTMLQEIDVNFRVVKNLNTRVKLMLKRGLY